MIRAWRLLRLALHLLRGVAISAFFFPFQSTQRRQYEVRRWSAGLLSVLALRLHVHGAVTGARPLMLVANHVSWLDIFAIDAVTPARFVAKSEIRGWPVIGWLSAKSGTLFIRRARRRDTALVNDHATAALLAGDVFAVFPEGTTTDGSLVLKFHSSLLAPAITADATVQPVAIRYERADGSLCVEAAYDGDKTFWQTLMAIGSQSAIDAHLWFLPPIRHAQRHRRELAAEAREAITRTLYRAAPNNRTATAGGLPA